MAGIKKELRVSLEQWVDKAVRWHSSGCLLWVGPIDEWGYPRIYYGGKNVRVTRMICGASDDRRALHTCDVPCCIEPEHLYVGTAKENAADMVRRGRAHTVKDATGARYAASKVGRRFGGF